MRHRTTTSRLVGAIAAAALVLAACGTDDGQNGEQPGEGPANGDITIGVFSGWEEGIAASYLWGNILEQEGYNISYETADPGPIYAGVAQGQFDISFDAWLPATHEDYWAEHGEDMEDLGTWFDDAPLTIAVNEDAPIQSLTELAGAADEFDNRIIGIEPGAGLTRITREDVMPTYGLDDMQLVESSTPAMLAELEGAIERGDNVVVTLWRPHWAYEAFPVRDLEDPENALGDPEELHSFARTGFTEDFPEVAEWVGNFALTDDQLHSLEKIMFFENKGEKNEESVEQWLEQNPDFIEALKAGTL
ncbi:MAG: glycine betaine ABC transporter substrate-binding protein [Haloechinothrix sp.]